MQTPLPVLKAITRAGIPGLFLLTLTLMMASSALAQSIEGLPTIEELSAPNETSTAMRIFASMFGNEFVSSPLTQIGPATGLLGNVFFIFNGALFVVGTAFILYSAIMMTAVSAHKGEVLGERMSSLWIPIRLGTGIFGMAPVFMGFSMAQAVMFLIAILGNNLGDMMSRKAIELNDQFEVVVPAPGLSDVQMPVAINQGVAENLFAMHVCFNMYGSNRQAMEGNNNWFTRGISTIRNSVRESWAGREALGTPGVIVAKDGSISVSGIPINCGGIKIIDQIDAQMSIDKDGSISNTASKTRDDSGLAGRLGFRNSAVQYDKVKEVSREILAIRKQKLLDLNDVVGKLAFEWSKTFADEKAETPAQYPASALLKTTMEISNAEKAEVKARLDKLTSGEGGGLIARRAKEKMLEGGWMTLGSWYSVFAESNAAIQSAAVATRLEPIPMELETKGLPESVQLAFSTLLKQKENIDQSCMMITEKNPTGNCAPMQNFLLTMLDATVNDTGGANMVNPIIASKNIGDWMLVSTGTAIIAAKLAGYAKDGSDVTFLGIKVSGPVKVAADIAQTIAVAASSPTGPALAAFLGSPIWPMILSAFLVMGIMLAVYLPLIPFITWFTASISYFASVVEGLVAAQVWAFSHLHTEGEGMGQRTEKGYVYMLNMLLRPALMILGFFFASAILVLLGTFFFHQMGPAIANLQGNTTTGFLIMLGLVMLFMGVTISMVQTVFNMVYEVPDRVIAWFGHGMEARMAKEMDHNLETKVGQGARWSAGAAGGAVGMDRLGKKMDKGQR